MAMNLATSKLACAKSGLHKVGGIMATVRENFPRNLAKLLEVRGRKSALAKRLGVSPVTVGQWADGKILPELGRLDSIAEALGVSVFDLLADPPKPKPKISAADLSVELDFRESIAAARRFLVSAGYKVTRDRS